MMKKISSCQDREDVVRSSWTLWLWRKLQKKSINHRN